MKKMLLIGMVAVLTLVVGAGLAIPAFAHGSDEGNTTTGEEDAWQEMYQACGAGDWEAMAKAAKEVHGNWSGYMPCGGWSDDDADEQTDSDVDLQSAPEFDVKNQRSNSRWDGMMSRGWGGMGSHMGSGWNGMMGW